MWMGVDSYAFRSAGLLTRNREGQRPGAVQALSFQPVRKIHQMAPRQSAKNPKMAATLMPTLTSATP